MAANRLTVREYPDMQPPIVSIETSLSRRVRGRDRNARSRRSSRTRSPASRASRSSPRRAAGRALAHHHRVQPRSRHRVGRQRRARPRRRACAQPAGRSRPAGDRQGRRHFRAGHVDESRQRPALGARAHRLRRALSASIASRSCPASRTIRISGERRYAMRVWLDRQALAARKLTVQDVERRAAAENVELPAGRIESIEREFTLRTDTGLHTPEDFRQLVIGSRRRRLPRAPGRGGAVELRAPRICVRCRAPMARPASAWASCRSRTANVLEVAEGVQARDRAASSATLPDDIAHRHQLRRHRVRQRVDQRGGTRAGDRALLVLIVIYAVPRHGARDADSGGDDSGLDHRRDHRAW